jgi:hypothetical protein
VPKIGCLTYNVYFILDKLGGNAKKAKAVKNEGRKEMANAARKYPLFVNDFFVKHVNLFMKTVMK